MAGFTADRDFPLGTLVINVSGAFLLGLGERDRTEHHLLADALLDLYERHAIQSSILLRGVEGFGLTHRAHTDRLLTLSEDLPVVSVAIDTRPRIDALLTDVSAMERRGLLTLEPMPELAELTRRPLLTLERVRVCKRDGQRYQPARDLGVSRRPPAPR